MKSYWKTSDTAGSGRVERGAKWFNKICKQFQINHAAHATISGNTGFSPRLAGTISYPFIVITENLYTMGIDDTHGNTQEYSKRPASSLEINLDWILFSDKHHYAKMERERERERVLSIKNSHREHSHLTVDLSLKCQRHKVTIYNFLGELFMINACSLSAAQCQVLWLFHSLIKINVYTKVSGSLVGSFLCSDMKWCCKRWQHYFKTPSSVLSITTNSSLSN